MFARFPDFDLAANRLCLAIAALAAIACLATIHRAILAGVLARRLICRQCSSANNGRDNGTDNFDGLFHTNLDFPSAEKLREKKFHESWSSRVVTVAVRAFEQTQRSANLDDECRILLPAR
jgi:hypothetical protein